MRSATHFALLSFLLFFLLTNAIESRKDQAGEYWRKVMKDEAMPKEIQGLIQSNSKSVIEKIPKSQVGHKCEEEVPSVTTNTEITIEKELFVEDIEPRPSVTAYKNDDAEGKKKFMKDFKVSATSDFEPTPNISAYDEDKVSSNDGKPSTNGEFEPGLNISAYGDE